MTSPDTVAVLGVPLDARTAQTVYRAVLDALSRPGSVRQLPESLYPAALLPVLALADLETGVHVVEPAGDEWAPLAAVATGAPAREVSEAKYVVVLDPSVAADAVRAATAGTAQSPETGATVVIAVDAVAGGTPVRLAGPGVATETEFAPAGADPAVWAARATRITGFPAGVDLLFVGRDGRLVGVPRTAAVTFETVEVN
ncbi:phosphonate C-P lyase system protein PhnH [Nocardia sp. NPDC058499]|uniref:phosphonate C-P lyase system protein PhnH n=1 Tax=Nocardia sp. NPDC058499 TaxID=3346530 RepID=UPI003651C36B